MKLCLSFDGILALAGEDNRGCHGSFDFWELFYQDMNDILLGYFFQIGHTRQLLSTLMSWLLDL